MTRKPQNSGTTAGTVSQRRRPICSGVASVTTGV